MPQNLRTDASTETNIYLAKRHERLTKQQTGAKPLYDAIHPYVEETIEKYNAYKAEVENNDAAYDSLMLVSGQLKNQIRTASDTCKSFDRDNPGARIKEIIFPENTGSLMKLNPFEATDEFQKIVTRFQSLGTEHALYGVAAKIMEKIDVCLTAVEKCGETVSTLKLAEAQLEIAEANLLKKYSDNILDAEKMFGKNIAAHLFPRVTPPRKTKPQN